MEENTAVQVIELKQVPVIIERLQGVKAQIEQETAAATSLICTEDTYKKVKEERAKLTKEFKNYEAQRIAIKDAILAPYNEFEKTYRECITDPFEKADAELKGKITDVTSGIVAQKTDAVLTYYNELVEAAGIDWLDGLTYRPKVNMSDSVTALKKQAKAFVDGIVADAAKIELLDSSAEIMVEYRSSLDLASAIGTVEMRHKALEEQRRREEERRIRRAEQEAAAKRACAAMNDLSEAVRPVQEISTDPEAIVQPEPQEEPKGEPQPEDNRIKLAYFKVSGTLKQLKALKNYLEKEGMRYETIQPDAYAAAETEVFRGDYHQGLSVLDF